MPHTTLPSAAVRALQVASSLGCTHAASFAVVEVQGDPVTSFEDSAEDSAAHWARLADESEARARWNREHGLDLSTPGTSPGDYQARLYRQTAEALRREASTGQPHCSSCGGAHPNHHHPSVAANCGCRCKQVDCPWCA